MEDQISLDSYKKNEQTVSETDLDEIQAFKSSEKPKINHPKDNISAENDESSSSSVSSQNSGNTREVSKKQNY